MIAKTLLIAFLAVLVCAVASRGGAPGDRVMGYGQIRFAGAGPEKWAARYRREHRTLVSLRAANGRLKQALRNQRRILLRRPQVVEAINLACATYGHCSSLWRKAQCETGGSFSAASYNTGSGASGLFQFLPGTWRSTPFARLSVFSPYANALAAGWMHSVGRGGEWTCR